MDYSTIYIYMFEAVHDTSNHLNYRNQDATMVTGIMYMVVI